MKRILSLLVTAFLVVEVLARGRVFQRFSPDLLANLGYGGGPYREVLIVISSILQTIFLI